MKNALIIMILAVALAAGLTGPKLYKMCQIRGWIEGAKTTNETIAKKWNQTPDEHPKQRSAYWVSWSTEDIRKVGPHRINLTQEHWDKIKTGDQIEIVRIPGDPHPYLRDGIFADDGNLVFDVTLLIAEIVTALVSAIALISIGLRSKTRRNPPST